MKKSSVSLKGASEGKQTSFLTWSKAEALTMTGICAASNGCSLMISGNTSVGTYLLTGVGGVLSFIGCTCLYSWHVAGARIHPDPDACLLQSKMSDTCVHSIGASVTAAALYAAKHYVLSQDNQSPPWGILGHIAGVPASVLAGIVTGLSIREVLQSGNKADTIMNTSHNQQEAQS